MDEKETWISIGDAAKAVVADLAKKMEAKRSRLSALAEE